MEAEEFNYFFEHGEFMPSSVRDAKKAAADTTIERPARKISMTDGYAGEKTEPPAEADQTEPPRDSDKE